MKDNIFTQRMRNDHIWFLKMSLLYGVLFVCCLYRNTSGITCPVLILSGLGISVLFLRRAGIPLQKGTVRYFAGILLLAVSTVRTDSGFLHFFNNVGILLLFMMSMAHQLYQDQEWGFTDYIKKFFRMLGTWILSVGKIFQGKNSVDNPANSVDNRWITGCVSVENRAKPVDKSVENRKKMTGPILMGILAAALMLLIVLPLLMMSDEVFSQIFGKIFRLLDPFPLLAKIDIGSIFGIAFTFLFGTVSLYAFFAGLFRMNLGGKDERKPGRVNVVTGITFTGIMAAVYVLYSAIQILFLFLRLDTGLPAGVTYSQYAHQGFWQLLAVSLLNFITVLLCAAVFGEDRILKSLLALISACTCVMILSAAYRMMLYVETYDLTFLRVLVLWFLGVLMVIFCGVIYFIFRRSFRLFRYITLVVSVGYILFSLARPDALIAGYNLRDAGEMNESDLCYLIYSLSEDAAPHLAEIDCSGAENAWMEKYLDSYFQVIDQFDGEMSLREWNYSRAAALDAAEKWIGKSPGQQMTQE